MEIYENDKVCIPYIDCIFGDMVGSEIDKDVKYTVVMKDGCFCIENEYRILSLFSIKPNINIEVIGNIHESEETSCN